MPVTPKEAKDRMSEHLEREHREWFVEAEAFIDAKLERGIRRILVSEIPGEPVTPHRTQMIADAYRDAGWMVEPPSVYAGIQTFVFDAPEKALPAPPPPDTTSAETAPATEDTTDGNVHDAGPENGEQPEGEPVPEKAPHAEVAESEPVGEGVPPKA